MSFVLRLPRKIHLGRSSSNVPRLPSFLEMRQNPHILLIFDKVHNPLRLPRKATLQRPKVARACSVLYMLTSKCASRHNGVQLFISHLASWLRTRRVSEPTFRPSGATNHWKNTVFRDFPIFSRTWIFFLLTLSLSSSLLFSDSSHLCFSSVHIVGSLTSKLPSIMYININMRPLSQPLLRLWAPSNKHIINGIKGMIPSEARNTILGRAKEINFI